MVNCEMISRAIKISFNAGIYVFFIPRKNSHGKATKHNLSHSFNRKKKLFVGVFTSHRKLLL